MLLGKLIFAHRNLHFQKIKEINQLRLNLIDYFEVQVQFLLELVHLKFFPAQKHYFFYF